MFKKIFIRFLVFAFLILNISSYGAQTSPQNSSSGNLIVPEKKEFAFEKNVPASSKKIKNEIPVKNEQIDKKPQKNYSPTNIQIQNESPQTEPQKIEPKKPETISKNIEVEFKNEFKNNFEDDRIISEATRRINAIYPIDDVNPLNTYPGYRGTNQLVIYTNAFAKTTGTNEYGKEAVVKKGMVVALTGANSTIPRDGYIISGHGTAKKWITDNLKIGTKVEIEDRTLHAYTTLDSYRYCAKEKIDYVQDMLNSSKFDTSVKNDKAVYNYLKRAKTLYKKSKKSNTDEALEAAKGAIENASLAFRYTLPYMKNELKGTWVRPTSKSKTDIQSTLDKIKAAGINNIFLETFFHGNTIFPSTTMESYGFNSQNPDFQGVDILSIWLNEAHKRGIKVHLWFESFYIGNKNPALNSKSILMVKPSWMNRPKNQAESEGFISHPQEHNGYFLDPANPEVTNFLLDLINEITSKYNIDGLNVDYVRYPNIMKENTSNQWGYTKYAREEFKIIYDVDPIELTSKDDLWEVWCDYRSDKITNYVQKVSKFLEKKNIKFSTVIFPDYKISLKTKFQDWVKWADEGYVDALTPLILTADDTLAKSMLEEIKKKTSNNASIYPGLFAGFIESDPEDLLKQIHIARNLKMDGIILFDWAHLNDKYIDVLKASVFKPNVDNTQTKKTNYKKTSSKKMLSY